MFRNWYAIHNGQRIPYLLGILLGLDQFLHAFVPRADIDKTISHRLGRKKLKRAVRAGLVDRAWLTYPGRLPDRVKRVLYSIKLTGIPGWIDRGLEAVDPGHSVNAIGY